MLKTWPFNRLSDLQLRNLKVTVTLNDLDGKSQILASIDPSENGKGLFNGLRCSHTTKRHSFGRWNRDGLISLADAGTIHQQTPYSEGQWPVATNHLDHRLVWLCHLGSHYHCNGCGIKPNENRVRACWNTAMHPNWWSNYHIAIDIISTDIYIKTRFLSLKQRSKTSSFRMPGTSKPPFVELFAPLASRRQRNHRNPRCPSSFAACLHPNRIWTMLRESASCPEITNFWDDTPHQINVNK